jgi:hypothetical protein
MVYRLMDSIAMYQLVEMYDINWFDETLIRGTLGMILFYYHGSLTMSCHRRFKRLN